MNIYSFSLNKVISLIRSQKYTPLLNAKQLLLTCILIISSSQFTYAQKKKGPLAQIDSLMQTQKYQRARPLLIEFNKRNSLNALSHFWLARTYQVDFEAVYVHESSDASENYDQAILLFEKARGLVTKKDLKVNRIYYDELFGKKNYTVESVQAYMDEFVQAMQVHYTKLAQIKIRFASIPSNYDFCQHAFVQIISGYKTMTDMYLHISDRDIQKLGNIQRWYKSMKGSVDSYSAFFRNDKFAKEQQQHFTFERIEGMKSYRVDKKDFLEKKIKLFDYGTWATEMKAQIAKVRAVQADMLRLNDTLSYLLNREQLPADFSHSRLSAEIDSWKRKLLQIDETASPLLAWYDYRLQRLLFKQLEENAKKSFAITYPTKEERNEKIGGLIDLLVSLNQQVYKLDTREAVYKNHADFVKTHFGNSKQMTRFKVLEENFLTEKLREWNVIRIKMPDLAPIYPDFTQFARTNIALRPAKMDITSLLDSGYYLTEQVYPCLDSGFVIRGRYNTVDGQRKFLGKIARRGSVEWLKPFDEIDGEVITNLEKITPYNNGMTLFFARAKKGETERLKMLVFSDSGTVVMERLMGKIPENMYVIQDAPGIIFMNKAQKVADMLEGFEKYEIVGYRFDGEKSIANNLLLRGNLVKVLETEEGIKFAANFLEFQDLNGQFSDSRAYTKGGYNVLVGEVYLTDKQSKISPIYSLTPIAARKIELDPKGGLLIYGAQGDFKYHNPENIIGGDTWEVLFE